MSASNCPETPRQKMIQMMYLVYTAMLALNVAAEVLNGFKTVGNAMNTANRSIAIKIRDSYNTFDQLHESNPAKTDEMWKKAQEVKDLSKGLKDYLDSLQFGLLCYVQREVNIKEHIMKEDGSTAKENYRTPLRAEGAANNDESGWLIDSARRAIYRHGYECIAKPDDNNDGTRFFFAGTEDDPAPDCRAMVLKNRIISFKEKMMQIVDDSALTIALKVDGDFWSDHEKKFISWEQMNFSGTITIADMVVLARLKSEVMTAEYDAINLLYNKVSSNDFKFDQVKAIIRPSSTYIHKGGTYEAQVNIGAYDSKAQFEVHANGTVYKSDDEGNVNVKIPCGVTGEKKFAGTIYVMKNDEKLQYDFSESYFVAEPVAVISLTNMNVAYLNIDNPVKVTVAGIDHRNITPRIEPAAAASITPDPQSGAGHYIIRPKAVGKFKVVADVTTNGTKKNMGEMEIRAKRMPDPQLVLGQKKKGETVSKSDFQVQPLRAAMQDFEFKIQAPKIVSTEVYIPGKSPVPSTGPKLDPSQQSLIQNARRGQKVYIDAEVQMPDGSKRPLSANFRIQ